MSHFPSGLLKMSCIADKQKNCWSKINKVWCWILSKSLLMSMKTTAVNDFLSRRSTKSQLQSSTTTVNMSMVYRPFLNPYSVCFFSYRRFFASTDASSSIWTQVERLGRLLCYNKLRCQSLKIWSFGPLKWIFFGEGPPDVWLDAT